MADNYERNNPHSLARIAIELLLSDAADRIARHPENLPFKPECGNLVISWLRAFCERKPSELK